jgi:predicted MFS family arabinose efflux permease
MPDQQDKQRSLRSLDALNFFNAGIQTGLGPFIAIYYASARHWNPGQIGVLLSIQSLSGVALQSVVGDMVDNSTNKRYISAGAALIVTLGCLGIVFAPNYFWECVVQFVIGVSVTVFPAATASFALGLVEKGKLSERVSRNETFTHGGNVLYAGLAAVVGQMIAIGSVFYAAAVFAAGMVGSSLAIRGKDIDNEAARAGDESKEGGGQRAGWRDLFKDKRILTFTAIVVLFNVGNSSTLPLVGQLLGQGKKSASIWQVAACVIVAEIVMVGVAAFVGKRADHWGRKPIFLFAFAVLAARNILTVASHNQYYLISLQSLDGIAAAIYGVLLTLVVADLAKGTGRFNFLQGAVQSSMGLGGFLSNMAFGWVAKAMGFNASFIGLGLAAVSGGALYLFAMPETAESKQGDTEKKDQPQEQAR